MLFNSVVFLVFIPVFFLAYFLTRGMARVWVSFVSSYLFYGWWDWRFLGLIIIVTVVNYWSSLRIEASDDQRVRKRWATAAVVGCLALLAVFKYTDFALDTVVSAFSFLGLHLPEVDSGIILPVGISFFTFQSLSYTIDVYRKTMPAERSLLRFATFVAFFPQLVAGPIVRASLLVPQLHRDFSFRWDSFSAGFGLVVWGYFMKVGIADSLATVVDVRFASPEAHSGFSLLVGVVFYSFQIYCDFAGYSYIAIGIGRMLGYDLGINFDRPYFSANFSEFWKRWHISLSSWLRDYLYVPLGGNRKGPTRTSINLFITMLLGGLWHGASWTFVVWGGLHGLYLTLQRTIGARATKAARRLGLPMALWNLAAIALVFCIVTLTWVFFRARDFDSAWVILAKIFSLNLADATRIPNMFHVVKGVGLIAILWTLEAMSFKFKMAEALKERPLVGAGAVAMLLWLVALAGTFSSNAFIYFQF